MHSSKYCYISTCPLSYMYFFIQSSLLLYKKSFSFVSSNLLLLYLLYIHSLQNLIHVFIVPFYYFYFSCSLPHSSSLIYPTLSLFLSSISPTSASTPVSVRLRPSSFPIHLSANLSPCAMEFNCWCLFQGNRRYCVCATSAGNSYSD